VYFRRGDVVYDKADPRHVGVVVSTIINRQTANVRWHETGWLSFLLPWSDLRFAPAGRTVGITLSQPLKGAN
jgi:hypothetical protein